MLLVVVLTGSLAVWVHGWSDLPPIENERFFALPMRMGEWVGTDIEMSDYVYAGIETSYLLLRNYRNVHHGRVVNLALVWFDDRNIAFHTPEACLTGVTDRISRTEVRRVALGGEEIRMGEVVVDRQGGKSLALYYFDVDGSKTLSQSGIRLAVLKKRFRFERASASFIRCMTPVDRDVNEARETLLEFMKVLHPVLPDHTYTTRIRPEGLQEDRTR